MKIFILAGILSLPSLFSAPLYTVVPTLGPDFATSANFSAWACNVLQGLVTSSSPGESVAQFVPMESGATLSGGEFIESGSGGFTSWKGLSNPSGGFAGELGTALYFALIIKDQQGQETIRLSDLRVAETYLGQDFGISLVGGTYRSTLWGVDINNNVLNNGQNGATLVKELYYVGVGFVQPLDLSIVGTEQERLDGTRAGVQALADRRTVVCYDLGLLDNGCGGVNVGLASDVAEPSTLYLSSLGLVVAACWRRRRVNCSGLVLADPKT
jgi:hypothetical protein